MHRQAQLFSSLDGKGPSPPTHTQGEHVGHLDARHDNSDVPTQRKRLLSNPTIIGAMIAASATVLAAAVPVVIELSRSRSAADAPTMPAATPTMPAVTTRAVATETATAPTVSPTPSQTAGHQSLASMPETGNLEGWTQEPQLVAGQRRDVVLSASPCWLNDNFTATFVVSRRFSTLRASVGIADDSPVALPLLFSVLADGKAVFTAKVGLGKVRPVNVDISTATQVSLRVSTTSTDQCHGGTTGVWIAPEVRH